MGWIYYEQSGDALVESVPCTILRVVPKGAVEVTEKPVESGVTLTDHVVVKTRRLSATVFFSPIPQLPGNSRIPTSAANNPGMSVMAAQTLLRMIQETRKLNTITVPGDTDDDDLILESWTTTRENAAGNGGEFECEFIRLRFATAILNAPLPRHPRQAPRVPQGPAAPTPPARVSGAAGLLRAAWGENSIPTTAVR